MIGIGTAFIAAGFSNIMNYIQALFSLFNAPLFATFILGMFWKRMTPGPASGGCWRGPLASLALWIAYKLDATPIGTDLEESMWGSGLAFVVDIAVSVLVSLRTAPKPEASWPA